MKKVTTEKAWLSYAEAMQYSGLSRTKLWELVSIGEVNAARVGRAVRISLFSLEDYMKRNSYVERSEKLGEVENA